MTPLLNKKSRFAKFIFLTAGLLIAVNIGTTMYVHSTSKDMSTMSDENNGMDHHIIMMKSILGLSDVDEDKKAKVVEEEKAKAAPAEVKTANNMNKFLRRTSIMRAVCPNIEHLLNGTEAIKNAFYAEEAFHNKGGNLKELEKYLNWNIGWSLHDHKINFKPSSRSHDKEPTPIDGYVVSDYIRKTLKENDVNKRGGYDQHSLPGNYEPHPPPNAGGDARRNNWRFDVHEPRFDRKRWDMPFGPKMDTLCTNVETLIPMGNSRTRSRMFERKYMCGFNELIKDKETDTDNNNENKNEDDNQQCDIISIGSNGEWGFETLITNVTKCHTHTFDCTISKEQMESQRPKLDSVHSYPYCVSDEDKVIDDRKYLTFGSIAKKANLKNPPDLFKIDVEGFEYDFFTQMLNDDNVSHLLPSQISVEVHYATRMYDLEWMLRHRQAGELTMFNGMMYNVGGYIPVKLVHQGYCDSCIEVLYIRVFCD